MDHEYLPENLPKNKSVIARSQRCAIVGAGVSGLSLALKLCENDAVESITLFDKLPRAGGVLSNIRKDGYLLEGAAQGVLASRESFYSLLTQLDLISSAKVGDRRLPRFVVFKQRMHRVSPNIFSWFTQGLLSFSGLCRFLGEFFRPKRRDWSNETLHAFFARRFGTEFADRFVIPMATGIWAGGAKKILVRHVFGKLLEMEIKSGSLLRAGLSLGLAKLRLFFFSQATNETKKMQGLVTFAGGMNDFMTALQNKVISEAKSKGIKIRWVFDTEIRSLSHCVSAAGDPQACCFEIVSQKSTEPEKFHAVFSSAALWRENITMNLGDFCRPRLEMLKQVKTHGLVVVGLGGKDTFPPTQGFGVLEEEASKSLLGVLFIHSAVPEHVPKGRFLYRLMIGGDRDPDFVNKTENECIGVAKQHLQRLGLVSPEVTYEFCEVFKWPAVLPLQDELQDKRQQCLKEVQEAVPGFFFIGNYIRGVAVHDCLQVSSDVATEYQQALRRN